ncbi:hypothetical protein [Brevibacillus fulvus]|uniref:Transcriptional regulator n=1 Tax=Brevibacillus fulvus TaxID=1125967 RepID=A0A939BT69_9BACL|nr:hypothetical protein [Brevibacillus fulvus]MBM7589174.1 hypothetical protein [Brevibacillus fulvus]
MYRIGVVGPPPSVERILDVANEFEHEIEFVSFVYEDAKEVSRIVEQHQADFDGWFFSGPIPHMFAKKVLRSDANIVYCHQTGANLYRGFCQMAFEQQRISKRVSIDMIDSEVAHMQESLAELGVPAEDTYLYTYDEQYDPVAIAAFHQKLWEEGKVQGAFTTLFSVERRLKLAGVPVYRILMTKMEIRQAMKIVLEKAKSSYFKDTQIGMEIIEIEGFDEIAEKSVARYHLQHLELAIQKILLHYCESVDGSLIENGNGCYKIVSSRGALEREIEQLRHAIQQIAAETDAVVAVGIGYGDTAYSAETHARKAIQHAKVGTEQDIVIVQEDGLIVESAGQQNQLLYAYRSTDRALLKKLNQANVSIKTFRKIEALVQKMGWTTFSSADLAQYLSMSVRNVQRIMGSLCEAGLIETKGEEMQSVRGRPRKLYALRK